ncbi:MAG TPA: AraC family transcriptional regulator [Cyclobacteriaceae bacterium]|nr:AraC family transcriptional regulator [Cyclobacteriaceae bacterium]
MLLHEFPDIHWLKSQIQTRFENQKTWDGRKLEHPGWPTVILNTKAKKVIRENISGPLSIFTTVQGNSSVAAGNKQANVNENTFFVSNPKQEYTLSIPNEAETFNIHIGEKIGKEIWHDVTHSNNYLLDYPFEISTSPELHNRIHWRNNDFNSIISKIAVVDSEVKEQELLGELIFLLLDEKRKSIKKSKNLQATKSATREEIARRLHLATDLIYTHFDKDLSLDDLSRVSCLSKFHFIRLFKEYFNESPYQFITRLRLEKAVSYLNSSRYTVKEISEKVGIANSSSFSRLFKNHFGVYPTQLVQA